MKHLASMVVAAVLLVGANWYLRGRDPVPPAGVDSPAQTIAAAGDTAREAFDSRASERMLDVSGRVQRVLADDRDGSPHQRFIIATDSGQTLLVAHNLELAPRLDGIAVGDTVRVHGEYEWNAQGGVMHWTHDDPKGTHEAGYIEWKGRRYQ